MNSFIGILLILIAAAVALPAITAVAQALLPVLIALLIGSVALKWLASGSQGR